jgi:hypothetical protein
MPQFNGKQGANPIAPSLSKCSFGFANLRCPRNGKRMNFPGNSAPSSKPLGAPETARLGRRWNDPPARIPANKVAAPSHEGAAVTPNVLAGKPVRVLKRFRPS